MAVKRKEETEDLDSTLMQDSSNIFNTQTSESEDGVKESEEESPKTISLDQVKGLMDMFQKKLSDDFDKKLAEEVKKIKSNSSIDSQLQSEKTYTEDLLEDWLPEPVSFFSYNSSYSNHGDYRYGKEVLPPNGMIKFKNLIRTKRRVGRDVQVISISTVSLQSKAEVEYMRNNSLYGVVFHESLGQTLTIDAMWAQKLIEAHGQVGKMSDSMIISRCKTEGIPLGTDIQLMKKMLTEKVAKKAQAQMEQHQEQLARTVESMTLDEDGVHRKIVTKTT